MIFQDSSVVVLITIKLNHFWNGVWTLKWSRINNFEDLNSMFKTLSSRSGSKGVRQQDGWFRSPVSLYLQHHEIQSKCNSSCTKESTILKDYSSSPNIFIALIENPTQDTEEEMISHLYFEGQKAGIKYCTNRIWWAIIKAVLHCTKVLVILANRKSYSFLTWWS